MDWLKGYRTIIFAVVAMLAAKAGLHWSGAQSNVVVDAIPDVFAGLMIVMRLFTSTPLGQKVEKVAVTQLTPIIGADAMAPIQAALNAHANSVSDILTEVASLRGDVAQFQAAAAPAAPTVVVQQAPQPALPAVTLTIPPSAP